MLQKHFDALRTGDISMHLFYQMSKPYHSDMDGLFSIGCIDATDAIPSGSTRTANEFIGNHTATVTMLRGVDHA